jgi:hypothetical protein
MPEEPAVIIGKFLGKLAAASFFGWLITAFELPLWAVIIILLIL